MPLREPEVGGGGPYPAQLVGHLLAVWATEYLPDVPSKFTRSNQPSDVIVVDIVDLDETDDYGQPGKVSRNVWWRPGKLIQALRDEVGMPDPVFGRMGLGTAQPGFNAPYVLIGATADPAAVARWEAWEQQHPNFKPTYRGEERQVSRPAPAPNPQPQVQTQRNPTELELKARLARIAQDGADRLPPRPPAQSEREQYGY